MSLSMAYATKKKQKMAEGGEPNDGSLDPNYYVKGVHKPFAGQGNSQMGAGAKGHWSHGDPERNSAKAKKEHEKVSAEASQIKPKLMAQGGEMTHPCIGKGCEHMSHGGEAMPMGKKERAMNAFHGKPMAEGGQITDNEQSPDKPEVDGDLMDGAHLDAEMSNDLPASVNDDNALDMIGRILSKHMMSKGGMIANEDQGESASVPSGMAKDDPNEFDDLALRDDMDSGYTGGNSGDELGNGREDSDEADIISRVMRSRSKRDRMAVSGEGSTYGKGK